MFSIVNNFDIKTLGRLAADTLSDYVKSNAGRKILFLVAGGSSLEILNYIDQGVLSPNITIAVLDERYSVDPNINNFAQLKKTKYYKIALKAKCNFINSFPNPQQTHEHLTKSINNKLKRWLISNPDGKVIATIGIGTNGHIAGIMPRSKEASLNSSINKKSSILTVDAEGKDKYSLRITPNIQFLQKNIDIAVTYAVGKSKKYALQKFLKSKASIFTIPAKILLTMKNVTLFTDQSDIIT